MARLDSKDRGLFERPKDSGIWWVRWHDAKGKEHREKVGSKAAARQLYQKRKEDVRIGKKLPENLREREKTVGEVIEAFKPVFAAKKSATDDARYATYMIEAFGAYALSDLGPAAIEKWRRKKLEDKKKPATVNRAVAFLKRVYNLAIRDGLFPGPNPVSRVKQLRENNSRVRYLSDAEEKRLRPACNPDFWLKVEFAYLSGLRQMEQFTLTRSELDFQARVITVRESKHGDSRTVPMTKRLLEILEQQLATHSSDWVFPGRKAGTHFTGAGAIHGLKTVSKAAGINDLTWHDLRHTFCSRLAMAGHSTETIRQLAGHKSSTVTQRYMHLSPTHNRNAMESITKRTRPDLVLAAEVLDDPTRLAAVLQEHLSSERMAGLVLALSEQAAPKPAPAKLSGLDPRG